MIENNSGRKEHGECILHENLKLRKALQHKIFCKAMLQFIIHEYITSHRKQHYRRLHRFGHKLPRWCNISVSTVTLTKVFVVVYIQTNIDMGEWSKETCIILMNKPNWNVNFVICQIV